MDDKTEKRLIELVRPHLCLYDNKFLYSKDHETLKMRKEAWNQIANELELSETDVKAKWTKIRLRFHKRVATRKRNNCLNLCPDYYEHLAFLIKHLTSYGKSKRKKNKDDQNNFRSDLHYENNGFQNISNTVQYSSIQDFYEHPNTANSISDLSLPSNSLNVIQTSESTSQYNPDGTKAIYLDYSHQADLCYKNIVQNISNTAHYSSIQEDRYEHPNIANSISEFSFLSNSLNIIQGDTETDSHCNPDAIEVNNLNNSHQADSCHENIFQNISNTTHYSSIQKDRYDHSNVSNSISVTFPSDSLIVIQENLESATHCNADATEANYLNNSNQADSCYENIVQNISNTEKFSSIQEDLYDHPNKANSFSALSFLSNSLNVIQGDIKTGSHYNTAATKANNLNSSYQADSCYENVKNISNTAHNCSIQKNFCNHPNIENALSFAGNFLNVIQGDTGMCLNYNLVVTKANYLNNPLLVQNQKDANSFQSTKEEFYYLINN